MDEDQQHEKYLERKIYIVLQDAPLLTAKIDGKVVLINSDQHKQYINKKLNKDYSTFRPDILHQSLLLLQDSPLNKAGFLKIFVHTESNVIIDISPDLIIPRTYRKFAAMMAQALTKLRVRAVESS